MVLRAFSFNLFILCILPTNHIALRSLILLLLLLALLNAGFCLAQTDSNHRPDKTYTVADLREDLDVLHETLTEADPALYRYLSRQQVDAIFSADSASITAPMTEDAFKRDIVIPTIVALRDLHFVVYPSEATENYLNEHGNYFPFDIRIVKDRAYIWRNMSADTGIADHGRTEILSINGVDIKTIVHKLESYIVVDGNSVTAKRTRDLEQSFRSYYGIVYGRPASYSITVKGGKNKSRHLEIPAATWSNIDELKNLRYPEKPELIGLNIPDHSSTAVLMLRTFNPEQAGITDERLQRFIDSSFRVIHDRKIKNLVLDLRGNYGGRMNYGGQVYSYLTDSPYKYIDRVELIFPHTFPSMIYTSLGRTYLSNTYGMRYKKISANDSICIWETYQWTFQHPAAETPFMGKLYVLTDGYTFSTTGILCSMIRAYRNNTVFIGEETGGAYQGCSGNLPNLVLPHTQLRIHFPIRKFVSPAIYHPEKNKGHLDRGILPDVEVSNTIKQLVNDEDAVMKKALQLAGQ